jgi:hypothetical protein
MEGKTLKCKGLLIHEAKRPVLLVGVFRVGKVEMVVFGIEGKIKTELIRKYHSYEEERKECKTKMPVISDGHKKGGYLV